MTDAVEGLKQRVVGAVVILSLAVIFLPMIFDKPHETESATIVPIPSKPEFKTVTVTKAQKPEFESTEYDSQTNKVKVRKPVAVADKAIADKAIAEKNAVAPSSKVTKVAQKPEPVKATEVKPKKAVSSTVAKQEPKVQKAKPKSSVSHLPAFKNVWMVQLGTFSNKTNAYRLRDKLRKDGFDSHTKPIKINGKPSIRVFSGPYVSKREAAKRKQKLDAKYGVKSIVLFFEA